MLSSTSILIGTVLTGSVAGSNGAQSLELNIQMIPGIWINGATGAVSIEYTTNLDQTSGWTLLSSVQITNSSFFYADAAATNAPKRFYRAVLADSGSTNAPAGMALIPAGSFTMGDTFNEGDGFELPTHTAQVRAFYIDKYEVTKTMWDDVKTWAVAHGYSFSSSDGEGEGPNYPVFGVSWYAAVKWCNARSEKEGRVPAYYTSAAQSTVYRSGLDVDLQNDWVKWNAGYRLPTESEWEKAARGGAAGHRCPWSDVDTITHSQANYYSKSSYAYDLSSTGGYTPGFWSTSPVGAFPDGVNGYGLYDMAGNVWEWCWDWSGSYSSSPKTDPLGPPAGSRRVTRGGTWCLYADTCRVSARNSSIPDGGGFYIEPDVNRVSIGIRPVLPAGQ